jgi:hypothetical protein
MKSVRIDRQLLARIRQCNPAARQEIGHAITSAQAFFGAPHLHGGAGVRKLKDRWYEVRSGLDLRLIFRDCDDCLSFEFTGSHDEVRRFLKGVK